MEIVMIWRDMVIDYRPKAEELIYVLSETTYQKTGLILLMLLKTPNLMCQ